MSEISNLSREADLICKHKINKMVSYPKNNHNKLHSMPSELSDEESSSDSSASNSSFFQVLKAGSGRMRQINDS